MLPGACVPPISVLVLLSWPVPCCRVWGEQGCGHGAQAAWHRVLPGLVPACARLHGQGRSRSMDRSTAGASRGLVSRYRPAEPWPWLSSHSLASSCVSHMPASTACSLWGFGKPVSLSQLWDHQTTCSPGTQTGSTLGKTQLCRETAPQGEEIHHQEIPTKKGSFPGCHRAGNGGERAACVLCRHRHGAIVAMVLSPAACRALPAPRRHVGRELPAWAYPILREGRCFSCWGWMISRSSLEI